MPERQLIRNASLARMTDADPDYALMRNGAVAIDGGQIAWVGPDADLPPEYRDADSLDAEGRFVTPALIDCHTHLVHGGNRAREFEMRLEGASYEEIARAGGGIVSTVTATRAAAEDQLFAYIDDVCAPALEAAHAEVLVDAVDGFCEGIAFDVPQIARVFEKARSLGLPVKLHAEQLSHIGGTKLAADFGALSADHVEYATEADARSLAQAGSVAVLLPGAFYTLHETQKPPVAAFRAAGVPMAVATDWNPGSSPMGSVLLAMNMGCTLFGLTPAEALAGTTRNAARALGLRDRGMIAPGMRADLALWDVEEPAELSYRIGVNPLYRRIFGGQL